MERSEILDLMMALGLSGMRAAYDEIVTFPADHFMTQMARATQLKGVAGVRLGRLSDIQPNDPPWTEPVETMMARWCGEMGVAWLGAADVGHDAQNKVVPFGIA